MRPLQNSFLSQTAENLCLGFGCLGEKGILQRSQFVKTAKQVEIDAGSVARNGWLEDVKDGAEIRTFGS